MKDGTSYSAHLHSVVRQSGGRVVPPELQSQAERPERAVYLWNYFAQLSRRRGYDSFSGAPLPLSNSEVLAWATLNRVPLQTFEADLLFALDDVYLRVKSEEVTSKRKREEAATERSAVKGKGAK